MEEVTTETHEYRRLLPLDPLARAHTRNVCDVIDTMIVVNYQAFNRAASDTEKKVHFVNLLQGILSLFIDVTKTTGSESHFLCGNTASLPDVLLAPVAQRITTVAPVTSQGQLYVPHCSKFERFWRWLKSVEKEEFYSKIRLNEEKL